MNKDIPVIILCGGKGSRIRDIDHTRPKPLLEIGGKPILWHVMHIYAAHGFKRFVLCLGYLGEQIRQFVINYHAMTSNFTVRLHNPESIVFHDGEEKLDWEITCVETGEDTMTGGRLWRVRDFIDTENFILTYGDGVSNVDLTASLEFHLNHNKIGTVTGIHPPARFGNINVEGNRVTDFSEKRQTAGDLINGGFFIFRREFIDRYLDSDESLILERSPLENLARDGELMLWKHTGFWQCMDTYRDYLVLEELWSQGNPPWRI